MKSLALCLHAKFMLRRWQEGGIILDNSDMLLRIIFLPCLIICFNITDLRR